MIALRRRFSLPLLTKELTEQAARKRTYVVRVIYAVLLFAAGAGFLWQLLDTTRGNALQVLGRGAELFMAVVGLQFAGIYLFLPALVSGAITGEKERQSLTLLMVTDLRPWEIIIQKLVGRLLPMLTFLLLSLPLMAIAYAFGGVTTSLLVSAVVLLGLTCLQVASFSLMLSSWCRSSVSAFMGTYILGTLAYFGPFFFFMILREFELFDLLHSVGWQRSVRFISLEEAATILMSHVPPWVFVERAVWTGALPTASTSVGAVLPTAITSAVFLLLARYCLVRRAFVPPRNSLLALFKWLDGGFHKLNRVTGNIMLVKPGSALPGDRPIAWRELTKRSLGQVHYLFRILVVMEAPALIVVALAIGASRRSSMEVLSVMMFLTWAAAALLIAVQAANTFSGERRRQTLDVLLTAPMSGAEIVRQKMAAVWRLMIVLMVPLLTIFVAEAWWEHGNFDMSWRWRRSIVAPPSSMMKDMLYVAGTILSIGIYLPMVAWLSLLIGMRSRSPMRAVITALVTLLLWLALAPTVSLILWEAFRVREGWVTWLLLASPASMIGLLEFFHELRAFGVSPWVPVTINMIVYAGCAIIFRILCYDRADRYLGRV
ncbi:MAG: hypothetical protein CMJ18_02385 [Phycisphaeraceae bacterium]|nr:hypothetical protein [Phycisphaeraceae bacterium]